MDLPSVMSLASTIRAIQTALASGKDRDAILLDVIEIVADPELNKRLKRVLDPD